MYYTHAKAKKMYETMKTTVPEESDNKCKQ